MDYQSNNAENIQAESIYAYLDGLEKHTKANLIDDLNELITLHQVWGYNHSYYIDFSPNQIWELFLERRDKTFSQIARENQLSRNVVRSLHAKTLRLLQVVAPDPLHSSDGNNTFKLTKHEAAINLLYYNLRDFRVALQKSIESRNALSTHFDDTPEVRVLLERILNFENPIHLIRRFMPISDRYIQDLTGYVLNTFAHRSKKQLVGIGRLAELYCICECMQSGLTYTGISFEDTQKKVAEFFLNPETDKYFHDIDKLSLSEIFLSKAAKNNRESSLLFGFRRLLIERLFSNSQDEITQNDFNRVVHAGKRERAVRALTQLLESTIPARLHKIYNHPKEA